VLNLYENEPAMSVLGEIQPLGRMGANVQLVVELGLSQNWISVASASWTRDGVSAKCDPMHRTPKDVVTRLLSDVWSHGDVSAVPDIIAERYTIFHDPGDPWDGQTLDRDGYVQRVLESRAPFPDQRFAICEMLAEGAKVAVTWTWSGTHRLPVAGMPATNRVIQMSGATIYSFEGAVIAGHWQITDRLGVFRQLSERQSGA
jgi:steroid delta-isomerase-like uncharacterized protein